MLSLFFKIYHTVRRWCYFIAKAVKFWGYALHFPCYIMFFTTKAGFWKSLFFKWSNVTVVTNGYCVYLFIVRYQQLHCNMRIKNQTHFSLLMNCTYNFKRQQHNACIHNKCIKNANRYSYVKVNIQWEVRVLSYQNTGMMWYRAKKKEM